MSWRGVSIVTSKPSKLAGISLLGNAITDVGEPIGPSDVATKGYVNEKISEFPDKQGLSSTDLRDDLTQTDLQTKAKGPIELWTSDGVIRNGALVVLDFNSDTAAIRVKECTIVPSIGKGILGVALNSTSGPGERLSVMPLSGGLCTMLMTFTRLLGVVRMDQITHEKTYPAGRYIYTDSGGIDGEYEDNETLWNGFDAGEGNNWVLSPSTWLIEHGPSSMWDRLGIQHSADGVTWLNVKVSWMFQSEETEVPWSSTKPNGDNLDGWIFPKNPQEAKTNGWDEKPFVIPHQLVRFYFYSDSGVTESGWNFRLESTFPENPGIPGTPGDAVFVDPDFPHRGSTVGTVPIGMMASTVVNGAAVIVL